MRSRATCPCSASAAASRSSTSPTAATCCSTSATSPTARRTVPRLGEFGRHDVEVTGGRLREILGERAAEIHSHHHQGIGRLGEGLIATAVAPDGLVEGVEDPSKTFCLGVLWHPEEDPRGAGLPLFEALVEQARAYRERATVQ